MNIEKLVGNTPMIKINYEYEGKQGSIYSKLEFYNYSGSIKDRIALYIIQKEKENGKLNDGQPIIEVTSGNTGIAFSAIGALFGHEVHIFMPDWVSLERRKLIEMYGAHVHLVSREDGGFKKALELVDDFADEIGAYKPLQFDNDLNVEAQYMTTGQEIIDEVPDVNAFVSGIGTGGTLMGVGKRLKDHNPDSKVFALEPSTLSILKMGMEEGDHLIEGIGDDFIPGIVDEDLIDDIVLIHDCDAINMSKRLAKEFGLGIGISSGANFLASVLMDNDDLKIATVFPDDNKKYITTKLSEEIDDDPKLISNSIKLLSFEVI
ncbi:MAG: cysteine synthase family protein [Methanobrevibacter sp.]|uniref:PLP-dependent cysteine synthase family protein n=1 Tax=Methanobrevibacter TaxID=2172 RepID=UPI00257EBBCD|nr:cysteine synthase family protein [Methanobrevibacter sp.]MBR2664938.1 cysteine synthase family protein [Methanobrevibacter sp.]MBR3197310.1 cysteine synthase family protein [Methanobrevibacter sp.]MBR6927674.1 cysteine synthase family protein [Methanobrevibacter sp.]MBR7049835.1 cysteine synthase family protein [Methanobrevibacter sp.]